MVMADGTDMSTPVTRGELQAELAHLATKAELEIWGGALLARIESGEQRLIERIDGLEQRFDGLEQRFDGFEQRFDGFEHRLLAELACHTRAIYESMSMQVSIIDEKYADLPPRMSWLEAEVFPPKRR
jgi:hypothetical protein